MPNQIKVQRDNVRRLAENLYKLLNQKIWIKILLGMLLFIKVQLPSFWRKSMVLI